MPHIPKLVPRRVRNAGGFTAPDPWNGNRHTDFTIEVYVLIDARVPRSAITKDAGRRGQPMYGIKSEIDGKERMLPASLVELWRTSRIPAEALPRLLRQMQSSLKESDYGPAQGLKIQLWMMVGASLVAFSIVPFIYRLDDLGLIYDGLLTLILLLLSGLGFWIVLRRRARYLRQMDWALAHL